jgi:hypothetical protein
MKISDEEYRDQLRARVEGGDLDAMVTYGEMLVDGPREGRDIERGLELLQAAHARGSLRAAYELATISAPRAKKMLSLSDRERAGLLLTAAMGGHQIAALDLYYHHGGVITADELRSALEVAAARGSTESRDILLKKLS